MSCILQTWSLKLKITWYFIANNIVFTITLQKSAGYNLETLSISCYWWIGKLKNGTGVDWGPVLNDPKRLWGKAPKAFPHRALWSSKTVDFWMKMFTLQLLYFLNSTASAKIKIAGNNERNGKFEQNNNSRNACLLFTIK